MPTAMDTSPTRSGATVLPMETPVPRTFPSSPVMVTDEGSIPREVWEEADKMRREVGKLMQVVDELRAVTARHDSRHRYFDSFQEELDKLALEILEVDGRIPSKNIIADIAFACLEMKMIPDIQEEAKHAEEKRILMEDLSTLKSRVDSIVPGLTEENRKELEGRFTNMLTQVMRGFSTEANSRKQAVEFTRLEARG